MWTQKTDSIIYKSMATLTNFILFLPFTQLALELPACPLEAPRNIGSPERIVGGLLVWACLFACSLGLGGYVAASSVVMCYHPLSRISIVCARTSELHHIPSFRPHILRCSSATRRCSLPDQAIPSSARPGPRQGMLLAVYLARRCRRPGGQRPRGARWGLCQGRWPR